MNRVIIFGGTGTLGSELVAQLYPMQNRITVFSRDELKQQEMKKYFPKIKYIIGDIRDKNSVERAMGGHDTVFHVAAMKHVDVIEENAYEAIQTNIHGSLNISHAALLAGVKNVIFSSTDKAVLPINIYGHTKAIIERFYLTANEQCGTNFRVFRWGNVLGSRGSVVHSFVKTLEKEAKVYLTHPDMTRFWIHIEDAVQFMITSTDRAFFPNRVLYPEMKAASVQRIAEMIAHIKGIKHEIVITSPRKGEKIHECLESNHEFCIRSDTAPQFTNDELEVMLKRVI